jgi:transposase
MDHPTALAPSQPEQARGIKPDSQGRAERVHRGRNMTSACFVGIDVSKDHLDLHARPNGLAARYANDPAGIASLLARVAGLAPERIVLEATGGFEAHLAAALAGAGLPVVIVNPRQVRDFAKATGQLAKTDAIDAAVLAHFAEAIRPEVRPLPDADAQALAALVDRRRQLVEMRTAEMNRLGLATTRVATSLRAHIAWLSKQLAQVDRELTELIQASPLWRAKDDLLQGVPGIGPAVSRVLVSELPELGTLSSKRIASLVGVAPMSRDSGRMSGTRSITGGRAGVRSGLYMAILSAVRYNEPIRKFYQKLRDAGKAIKVAQVAAMRKLLVILNAMIRDNRPWDPNFANA